MKRMLRALVGATMLGALLAVVPAPSALADHDKGTPAATNSPSPLKGKGTVGNTTTGWHEEMPDIAVAGAEVACQVSGGVLGGDAPVPQRGHNPFPPAGIDDPAHSHFNFLDTLITCADGAVKAVAEGGNDGHILPWEGGAQEADGAGPDCTGQHPYNKHHGAMTESGWSHSSDYSGGSATCPTAESNGGNTGACAAGGNNNKADLIITPAGGLPVGGSPNFVKYVRLGNLVYFWGCSNAFATRPTYVAPFKRRFSGVLQIIPDPLDPDFPICVVPGGIGCNLILVGASNRSANWAVNNRP